MFGGCWTFSPLKSVFSFGVNTCLHRVSLIQYCLFVFVVCFPDFALTYYEFGLTEYHCMSLILGINKMERMHMCQWYEHQNDVYHFFVPEPIQVNDLFVYQMREKKF